MIDSAPSIEHRLRSLFDVFEGRALNGTNETLTRRRKTAIDHFTSLKLPDRKTEAWKYTPIEKRVPAEAQIFLDTETPAVADAALRAAVIPGLDAWIVVTHNGRLVHERSMLDGFPEAVTFSDLHELSETDPELLNRYLGSLADPANEPFIALNTAFVRDGLFLRAPAGFRLEKPLHVIHFFDAEASQIVQPRMVYVAEENSEIAVIESFIDLSAGKLFVNSVTEWIVGKQARVDHYQIQQYGSETSVVQTLQAHQEGDSLFDTHTTTLQAGMLRNNLTIVPDAEACESHLFGFVMGAGSMHVDNHTLVDHKKPNCFSNELYKSILDDEAKGVFNGKVFVRPDAQKINAYQSNKSITLTQKARMYSKPELEIYADDVKCSHGATTGQLDAEALFYLRSRGLSIEKARSILLMAFARDVIDKVKIQPLRDYLDGRIEEAL